MNNLHINLNAFSNASRVLKQTKSLVDSGIVSKVYIVALHEDGFAEDDYIDESRELKRVRLKSKKLSRGFFIQIIKYFEFCYKVYSIYKNKKIDIINIHTLGLLPLGFFLKLIHNAVLVYDTHELETQKNGLNGFRKIFSKIIEKIFIKKVDLILVVSESISDWYTHKYNIKKPAVVFNAPNKRDLVRKNHFRENLDISEDQIILLYQGGLVSGRGVNLILEAFKSRKDNKIVAVFMGYGELESEIKSAASVYDNIFFFPAVTPDVVLEYTSSADMGLSLIENTCLSYYYCMPNKLFEYAMVGLPVLVSNMKDMSNLVLQNNMGAVIDDFSPLGINRALDNFLNEDLDNIKMNAYKVACENSWEIQEKKMLNEYKKILKIGS